MVIVILAITIVFGLFALFFLVAAMGNFAYPQSRTTVEVFPDDECPPVRWRPIFVYAVLGILFTGATGYLFTQVFVPAQRLAAVEAITRETFRKELGREPAKLILEDHGARDFWGFWAGPWRLTGTAWFDNAELWDVNVTWSTSAWKCEATRRP